MPSFELLADGVHEFPPLPAYVYSKLSMVASGSGNIAVEFRHPGSDEWQNVPESLNADAGNIVKFTGLIAQLRFTLSGSTGGAVVTANPLDIAAFDSNIVSGPGGFNRLRVDTGEPGFWAGRQFAWQSEVVLSAGEVIAFRFDLPLDVVLLDSQLTVDEGSMYYRVFRADQITETGTFATDATGKAHPLNVTSFSPAYALQTTAFTDGASASGGVTISGGATPYPVSRLRTSGATAQAFLVGASGGLARGFPPTSAYVVVTQLPGATGGTKGTITLKFEERDWGY